MSVPEPDSVAVAPGEPTAEAPRPQRGATAAELGRDVSATQEAAENETSVPRMFLRAAGLPFLLAQAEGYPIGIKQFLQLCLTTRPASATRCR